MNDFASNIPCDRDQQPSRRAAGRRSAADWKGLPLGFVWDSPTVWPHALEAFRQGLRDLGWVEGQNIVVEYRWAEGRFERLPSLMEELVRLKVDLIVAPTSIYTGAAKRATSTLPIVFVSHADPIGRGHVASFARRAPMPRASPSS